MRLKKRTAVLSVLLPAAAAAAGILAAAASAQALQAAEACKADPVNYGEEMALDILLAIDDEPVSGVSVQIGRVAELSTESGTFAYTSLVGDAYTFEGLTAGENEAIADELSEADALSACGLPMMSGTSGEDGKISFSNLAAGAYLVTQTGGEEEYVFSPFLAFVPEGIEMDGIYTWIYRVDCEPKTAAAVYAASAENTKTAAVSAEEEDTQESKEEEENMNKNLLKTGDDTKNLEVLFAAAAMILAAAAAIAAAAGKRRQLRSAAAVFMCTVLCTAAVIPVQAAELPSAVDTAEVAVEKVESGLTVTAYQLVHAVYAANGLTGYTAADGVSFEDAESPTAAEVIAAAKDILAGTISLTAAKLTEEEDGTYTAELAAGTWLILVSGSGTSVYNPMLVSNYYTDANDASSLIAGTVDAAGSFTENDSAIYAKSTSLYGSSSAIGFDKYITNVDENDAGGENGGSFDKGDTVQFSVTMTIPDYTDLYANGDTVFTVTDTLSDGFTAVSEEDVSVTLDGTGLESEEDTWTISVSDGQIITVTFSEDFVLENGGREVTISCSAKTTEEAEDAAAYSSNTAVLTYSTSASGDTAQTADIVYVYSFAMDEELQICNAAGSPIAGAEFGIYTDEECTELYTNADTDGTMTTGTDGYVRFSGLEEGTYYLRETDAPDGYAANDTVYKMEVSAEYNTDGTLVSYTIKITNLTTGEEYTNTYTANTDDDGDPTSEQTVSEPLVTTETVLAKLPSTGGRMAVICILVGAAGVIAVLLWSRRRSGHASAQDRPS